MFVSATLKRKIKRQWQFYLIILLPVLYLVIFHYIPLTGLQLAFKRYSLSKGIWGSEWVGFRYFRQFFASPSCFRVIWNTLSLSAYSIIAGFPFPIILAIMINEQRNRRLKGFSQMVTYAPYFISTVVMVGILIQVLDPRLGIVNRVIMKLGGDSTDFLGSANMFKSLYVWSGVWQFTGYSSIIYVAALSGVSPEMHEACKIDGGNTLHKIWYIDIPSIRPTIIILLLMSMGHMMSIGFEKVFLMQNPVNLSKSEIIATYVYKTGLVNANFGLSTAIGFFNSIVNLILIYSFNKIAQKAGETSLW
ncbi:sugar ABC transporter permease [Oceanispirochaeta sp. M2]|nr:sugar ABC transporter permease [Oceanispirochaeta sp. M2]NPD71981.1 sugar ABC transporter permease [Oceanispirochaeta sp. M1]RDG32787.1 sugar ABC transporter permease [Oceanispirochaeta sp. M1]